MKLKAKKFWSSSKHRQSYAPLVFTVVFSCFGVGLLVLSFAATPSSTTMPPSAPEQPAYAPQPQRNAEWTGAAASYSDDQIQKLANNTSYLIDVNFSGSPGQTIASHFMDVNKLVSTANQHGNNIGVLEHYNATFLYNHDLIYLQPYINSFNNSWYLKDTKGNKIAYLASDGSIQGYLVDLRNPSYRAWAVNLIASIMKAAPYKGILLDSADQTIGTVVRHVFSNGTANNQSMNDLLCGPGAPVNSNGDCSQMAAYNDGMAALVSQVSAALHPLGDKVIYNGIAPDPIRRPVRNENLISDADIATNENFCYDETPATPDQINFEPFSDDINIMHNFASKGKGVIEITDTRGSSVKQPYANYCLAGFLMGWQPGQDYYMYHISYHDPLTGPYPEIPEQNLNLGQPVTSGYSQTGNVMYRNFQNGIVAVNVGANAANFAVPAAVTEFKSGLQGSSLSAGTTVQLAPRSAKFYLSNAYLYPVKTLPPSGGGPGNPSPPHTANVTNTKSSKAGKSGTGSSKSSQSTGSSDSTNPIIAPVIDAVKAIEHPVVAAIHDIKTKPVYSFATGSVLLLAAGAAYLVWRQRSARGDAQLLNSVVSTSAMTPDKPADPELTNMLSHIHNAQLPVPGSVIKPEDDQPSKP